MRGRNIANTYVFRGRAKDAPSNIKGYPMWFEQETMGIIVPDHFLIEVFGRPHNNLYYKFYSWNTGDYHNEPGIWDPIIGSVPSQWIEVLARDMKLVEEIYDR